MLDYSAKAMEGRLDTRRILRWVVYIFLAGLVVVFLYSQLNLRAPQPDTVSLQALAREIKAGNKRR